MDIENARIPKSGQSNRKQIESRLNTGGIKMAKSFTPEEMESIRKNPNTWTVTSKRISLTKAAKERIIELLEKG